MKTQLSTSPKSLIEDAGQAGFIAALVMMAVQLIWRLNWSKDNVVQAFPEIIVAAVSRLVPLSVFGAATENYGSLAKKMLLLAVLLGIAAIGYAGGQLAGRLTEKTGVDSKGRLAAIGLVTLGLLLVTFLVITPIAHLGVFARDSSYTVDLVLQIVVTFGVYALSWVVLTMPALASEPIEFSVGSEPYNRREAFQRTVLNLASLGGMIAVGLAAWRLVSPKSTGTSTAVQDQAVDDIVATQRASQGYELPTAPATPEAQTAVVESASLTNDLALQGDDVLAEFSELEAEGHLTPVLTSTSDFYHVSKNLSDPSVDADGWTLKVTGLVDKELELTYEQLTERSTEQKITTLCCISNELNGSLISTGLWTGFPLVDLLNEAGVKDGAVDLKFHAADDYEDSVSVEIGMRPDNMVVIGLNGEPLTDDHGFPARLIIPDIFGMKNVKWIDRIEIVDEDFKGYWQTRGWSDTAQTQIWGRIDYPRNEVPVGSVTASGLASAGARDISRVEISLDDGESWADAELEPSLNPPFTWVRWAFTFEGVEGEYTMRLRATDGNGVVMDQTTRNPLPDGATGWPRRKFKVTS